MFLSACQRIHFRKFFRVYPADSAPGTHLISNLKSFIYELIDHFNNRASQREKLAFRVFDIYKNKYPNVLNEKIPEAQGNYRELIPDETFVLIGFYKSMEQYNWILKHRLYNYRAGLDRGSLILDKETIGAKYLLLHTFKQPITNDLWRITSRGPKVMLKDDLLQKGYPAPGHDHYLVYEIDKVGLEDFDHGQWDLSKLSNFHLARGSAIPFVVSLTDLMTTRT